MAKQASKRDVLIAFVIAIILLAALTWLVVSPALSRSEKMEKGFAELEKELKDMPNADTSELENLLKTGAG